MTETVFNMMCFDGSCLILVALGNIDQAQYCERIKGIIELLGSKLSLDELTKIWRIQVRNDSFGYFWFARLVTHQK